jgi:Rod binding domain-containing protein
MRTDIQIDIPRDELSRRKLARPGTGKPELAKGRGPAGVHPKDSKEFKRFQQVTKEFESLLLESMVKDMRKQTFKNDLFGKDSGMDTYKEMLDGEYVRLMSERGGIGLSDFMLQNTPPELMGKAGSTKAWNAAKAAGAEVDRASSFAGTDRQSLQTGLPASGSWGVNRRPGD